MIVLVIIGVVASLTIPALIQNTRNQEFKTAYKKAFSELSQAWATASANGDITPCNNWGDWAGGTCNNDNFKVLKKYFKAMKDCGTDTSSCWNMSGEKSWQGDGNYPENGSYSFIGADGFVWSKNRQAPAAEVLVDTNGDKGPNKYGQDRAVFMLIYYSNFNGFGIPGLKVNIPYVVSYQDMPDSSPESSMPLEEQQYRCPSIITDHNYHCYYKSWLTEDK